LRRGRFLLLAVLVGGCSGPGLQSDWERAHLSETVQEEAVAPPRYPRAADLLAIDVPGSAGFRFFVDGASVAVGRDRVVRYALVARSAQGAQNVTYEGIRCDSREYRIYAVGHGDGTWGGSPTAWQTLRGSAVAPARRALEHSYFCADALPVRDTGEALAALRSPRRSPDTGD